MAHLRQSPSLISPLPEVSPMQNDPYYSYSALSYSQLKSFASHSPFHFYSHHLASGRPPNKQTDSMAIGSAFHAMVLENADFEKTYSQAPDARRGTKAWKEAEEPNKILIKKNTMDELSLMRESLMSRPLSKLLFSDGKAEESVYWNYKNVPFKSRFDYRNDKLKIIIDLKTTVDASPEGFAKEITKNRYHWQAYLYTQAAASLDGSPYSFVFAAIEKTFPYAVGFYTLTPNDLKTAEEEIDATLTRYLHCLDTNTWPDFDTEIKEIPLPNFRRKYV